MFRPPFRPHLHERRDGEVPPRVYLPDSAEQTHKLNIGICIEIENIKLPFVLHYGPGSISRMLESIGDS